MNESMVPASIIMAFFFGMGCMGLLMTQRFPVFIITIIMGIFFAMMTFAVYGGEK